MRQRAEIVKAVQIVFGDVDLIASAPQTEPIMRLDDGNEVAAYYCDRYVPEGTKGWATFNTEQKVWAFDADQPAEIPELHGPETKS
jgi:hypothetical protein